MLCELRGCNTRWYSFTFMRRFIIIAASGEAYPFNKLFHSRTALILCNNAHLVFDPIGVFFIRQVLDKNRVF